MTQKGPRISSHRSLVDCLFLSEPGVDCIVTLELVATQHEYLKGGVGAEGAQVDGLYPLPREIDPNNVILHLPLQFLHSAISCGIRQYNRHGARALIS
ncbi:hypothetical protein EU527_02610 [Candidatus Thorarchaeota archaeon]|nr:MAG: hypothetical protein EU527_02610 [Candidatus Thorarchaeota archaeon]